MNGHDFKKVTRKQEWAHFRCRGCNLLVRVNVKHGDRQPSPFDLDRDVRAKRCVDIQVEQVMAS